MRAQARYFVFCESCSGHPSEAGTSHDEATLIAARGGFRDVWVKRSPRGKDSAATMKTLCPNCISVERSADRLL